MASTPSSFPDADHGHVGRWGGLLLAALAFVPSLLSAPGQVAADTKQYLYLSPGRLLRTAMSLWDPSQFGGYVTHQTIGYLWPAGPYYWLLDRLGVPDWMAQRVWLGLLFFAAGRGIWRLCRVLGIAEAGALAAASLYQLSPYVLTYANRTSILLSPWAGLGWILAFTILAARQGGWRYPALVALIVATVGGINATSLLLLAVAPLSWLVVAVAFQRSLDVRRAVATTAKVGVLSTLMSAWWIVALAVQSRFGADVLAYSETVQAVSVTSSAPEVVRGLGYWLFYGGDATGPWNSAAPPYMHSPGLIMLGFALCALSVASLLFVPATIRLWLTSVWLIGAVVAVGAHEGASPFARLLLRGNARSTVLLALRSSTRAVPLVLLAGALAVGCAVSRLAAWRRGPASVAAISLVGLSVLQLPAIWTGTFVDAQLRRPSEVPAAWKKAADRLGQGGLDSRVLEIPGQEFGAYRWGTTTDQLLPGLTDRPLITRDLLPLGSPEQMDLLFALDNRLQNGTLDPAAVAPIARLLAVGDVVVRGDERFEKYRTPRPERVAQILGVSPASLGPAVSFGEPTTNAGPVDQVDAVALSDALFPRAVPAATMFPVANPTPIVRQESMQGSVVIDGSGDGLVSAAAAGLLAPGALVRSAAGARDDDQRRQWAAQAGLVIITDSNRKRAMQWRGSKDTVGMTEDATAAVLRPDPADVRLPTPNSAGLDGQTLALQVGGTVHATSYGEPNAYRPEDRAVNAFDGDPTTFWRVAEGANAVGEQIEAVFDEPKRVETLRLRQPVAARRITAVTVTTGAATTDAVTTGAATTGAATTGAATTGAATIGAATIGVATIGAATIGVLLDDRSLSDAGQPLNVPAGRSHRIALTIVGTTADAPGSFVGESAVGLDVTIDGGAIAETVRPPTDLLRSLGSSLDRTPVAIVFERDRADAFSSYRRDPETRVSRTIELPVALDLSVSGLAHLSDRAADATLNPSFTSSGHLPGSAATRVMSAFDANPTTRWIPPIGTADGASLSVDLTRSVSMDHLAISQIDDARYSPADRVDITLDGVTRSAPLAADGKVTFAQLTGQHLSMVFHVSAPRHTIDRHGDQIVELPLAIAEIAVPGWSAAPVAPLMPSPCRRDLLFVDGRPLGVVVGTDGDLHPCVDTPIRLTAGSHTIATASGADTGIDVDRLVFTHGTPILPPNRTHLVVHHRSHVETAVDLPPAPEATWLVFGQGLNKGWHATIDGADLGPPQAVDAGSMGWALPSSAQARTVTLRWTPQRYVNGGLLASALGAALCLALVALARRPRAPDSLPTQTHPSRSDQARPFRAFSALAPPIVVGLIGASMAAPWVGVTALVVSMVASRVRPARRLGLAASVACMATTGLFVAGQQFRHRYRYGFGWPLAFTTVHQVALLGVLLLFADAVITRQRPGSGTTIRVS